MTSSEGEERSTNTLRSNGFLRRLTSTTNSSCSSCVRLLSRLSLHNINEQELLSVDVALRYDAGNQSDEVHLVRMTEKEMLVHKRLFSVSTRFTLSFGEKVAGQPV